MTRKKVIMVVTAAYYKPMITLVRSFQGRILSMGIIGPGLRGALFNTFEEMREETPGLAADVSSLGNKMNFLHGGE